VNVRTSLLSGSDETSVQVNGIPRCGSTTPHRHAMHDARNTGVTMCARARACVRRACYPIARCQWRQTSRLAALPQSDRPCCDFGTTHSPCPQLESRSCTRAWCVSCECGTHQAIARDTHRPQWSP
jgi:hypothetical protein